MEGLEWTLAENVFTIKPEYCDGMESKIRSRSGMRHAVAETEMTGETERDPSLMS